MRARLGWTVRTLHYYEQIGLLAPSARTAAGHRRYDQADVARLSAVAPLAILTAAGVLTPPPPVTRIRRDLVHPLLLPRHWMHKICGAAQADG